jgi:putative PIN family toxin of toxin-antitoxin system
MRLVIDANVWISVLLKPAFRARVEGVCEEHCLLFSEQLFSEIDRAVRKPYPAKKIVRFDYEKLVANLRVNTELVEVHSVVDACRDPKDNFLLALAKDGNADYLITGDDDLRDMKEFAKTKIVSLSDFEMMAKE